MIVCAREETSRELGRYLQAAGVHVAVHRELSGAPAMTAEQTMVLFPDDFTTDEVNAHLQTASAASPRTKLIVITAHPQRFERAAAREGCESRLIALPRPAFGWAILEAIRSDSQ